RLIRKNLITKSPCPIDKRAADIAITQAGLDVLATIDPHIDQSEKSAICLSREEATQLSDLLDKCRGEA
ncbi:MAG TPA: MarR family transcriptional regulator, partial [Cyclobacteriaceae bacterium]|nr:MarR family transcriptional regulator [Cyclobacteriaceae bacterium]